VLGLLLSALALMLATDAVLHAPSSAPRPAPLGRPVFPSADVAGGGVLALQGPTLRTAAADPSTSALALVGLPSEARLRAVLRATAAAGAKGTWFLDGRDAARRSGDLDRIRPAGFELGVTGFSGRDLRGLPAWRVRFELSAAQAALAGRQGIVVPILLLPATPAEVDFDRRSLDTARVAAKRGYVIAAGAAPGTDGIRVIDLERSSSDAALSAVLAGAPSRTVSQLTGLDAKEVNRRVSTATRWNGVLVVLTIGAAGLAARAIRMLLLPVTILLILRALLALVFAIFHDRSTRRRIEGRAWAGPVTVIVPAYNESAGIEAAVRSFVASDWPAGIEVVVVDDGSTDGTGDRVESLGLEGVRLLRQANAGKPAALNLGLDATRTDVVVLVDGDTLFQPDTVAQLVAPFADDRVGAVSGNVKVLNRGSLLGRWQHIEYVMGFNLDRRLLDTLDAVPTIPGAAGAFRREVLTELGGISDDTIAEDTDLTIAVSRAGWRVAFAPKAIAWTEAPSSFGDLWRQRYRWSYGTMQAAWKHRRALVEPRPIGPIGLTYALLFQVLLSMLAPALDVAALYALVTGDRVVVVVWLAFVAVQLAMAAYAFWLDDEPLTPLWALPLQQLVYRQLMYLVVIQSVTTALGGGRLRWHKLHRIGLDAGVPGAATPPRP
jgi:cellulose synthase/poly-beta-1,6-N-acetylglucosamine synthase-like glycosyltransferase